MAIGDLDGDGKPDLAVIQSSTVSVFRNTSDRGEITSGSFEARVDFTTGGVLVDVVIGDLDGDGKPDLALVNHGSNWVSMFRNTTVTGAITADSFAAMVNFTAGDAPFSIAIGDLNGDGKPDIAVANSGSNSVSVFINTSATGSITAGSFATKVDFTTGSTPNYVAIGDLDGDGKPELVVANNNSNTVSILRNTTELMPPIANTATSITQTQFNASWSASPLATDYRLDVSTSSDNFLSFVSGYNNLTVSGTSQTVTGLSPFTSYQYRVRAVNASMTSSNSNTISATTLAVVPVLSSFSPTSGPVGTSVTITGLNFSTTPASNTVYFGATKAAVISANTSQLTVTVPTGATYQPISVMVNGSTGYSSAPFIVTYPSAGIIYQGSFAGKVDFTPGTEPRSVAIGDLDGDGKPDLAVANGNSNSNTVSVFRNTSATGAITAGSFADKVDFTAGSTPFNVAIVDLDGDGKPDLAVANYASSTVSVFRNTSAGSITTGSFAAKVDFTTGTSPFNVAIGDLDGDGKPELAVTNFGSSSVSVFRNTSTTGVITASSFAAKEDFFTAGGTGPYFVAIGDLDGDGKPDLAVGNAGDNSVSVFRNTSATGSITTGSFAAKVDFTTGPNPYSVAIGDLDGDGKPELTVANNSSNSVSVFRNTSTTGSITTGSFAAKVDFTTGTNPYGIAIGDLDGDGKADFAVTNVVGNSVSVFKNNSATGAITANSFAAKVDFATGVYPKGIVIGDLDGDGKADLAVANDGSNKVSILRNTTELMPPIANPVTSITQTGFTASWNSPPGVLDYRLDVSSDNFLNFVSGYNNLTVAGTSQVVSGLSQFTSYQYRVRAVNASMTSANSNVISVTTLTVEPAVQASLITLVSKTTNSLTLNFTSGGGNSRLLVGKSGSAVDGDPIDATSYSPNSTFGSGSQIGTGNYVVGAGSSPITVSGLTPNTTYHFRVYEFNGSGGTENYNVNTSSGNPASFTTLFAEPTAQASGLIFSSVTSNSITVNFSNGNGASRLLVSKSGAPVDSNPADGITYISNNAFGNGSQLGAGNFVVGSGSAPITVTGLNPETTYHFRVFEFSGSGGTENYSTASASGNSASRSTLANEPVTQASSLALTNLTINSMDGMFAPATGAAGYVVLRKEGSPPPEVPTDETTYSVGNFGSSQVIYSGAATSFPSSGLTSATAYFYRVYAYNGAGVATNYLSVNPAEGNAMTLPVATVARPASNPTAASFTANWDPVTGAATYELDVSKDNFATFEAGFPKTGITEIEYTVISLAASTTYRYRVRSVNSAGGKSANSNNVTAVTSAPSADPLKINTAPTSSTLPVDFASTKLTVNVSGGTPPYVTVMKYRSITGNQFQSLNATFKSGNDYEVTVTESLLDQIGLEYYFEATDQITSLVKQSAHSFLYKAITTGSANTSIPFASGFNGKTASYRMFSIPYELEDKTIAGIFNELGDYDKTKWRLFRYDGIAEKYLEYQAGLPNSIELGNGYWFNAVSDLAEAIQIGTGTVKKANQAEPFTLNFVAGWNQIGNPYPFNIDWESIQTEPANENVDLGGLNLFEGGGYKDKSVLASWKGAFVFSVNGGPVSFPVTSRTTEGGRISQHDLPITLDEEIWQLPLTLSLHDLVQVSAIGMHLEAKRSKDKFDDITVPRFIDHLEMHTIHPEFFAPNFSTDMVPTGNQQDWLFTLSSNMEGPARLTWDQLEIAHSESQLILIDFTDQVWVDMKTTPHYSFSWKEGRQIKILYSRDGEINPGLSLLGQAYPNPFSNDVTIPVLVENEIAEVQVFDLLGRKVKTIGERFLTNGPHTFTWDGRDEQGNELSSGVLLYKMSGTRQVKRMIKQ